MAPEIQNPLISIALCTYNGERYLVEQMDSILAQTYSPIEIVIVDDGSSDRTIELIESYRTIHPNIRLFRNGNNLGYNKNFEKAISLCEGDFIAISDQDDIWFPHKIETLYNNIGNNWLIFSNSEFISQTGERSGKYLIEYLDFADDFRNVLFYNFITGHTSLLRKEIRDHILPVPEKGFYDWWIGFIALYHHKAFYLNEVLTCYRVHDDSVIRQIQSDRKVSKKLDNQLRIFLGYKELKDEDRLFISGLDEKLQTGRGSVNHPLFGYFWKNYRLLFPKKRKKNIVSKYNFIRKFLRGFEKSAG
jgi:glycosyltransferase involved in cell wall biosynthesis